MERRPQSASPFQPGKQHGVARAVLGQPSFVGIDNPIMLAALQAAPAQLRGIVVVAPTISSLNWQNCMLRALWGYG